MSPQSTYAITLNCFLQHAHFQVTARAELFVATLARYRDQEKFRLHAFAIMPNHVHLLLTTDDLAKSVQLIKGGYSFAVRKLTPRDVWQHGYFEHRVRDLDDFENQKRYIANNPPAARLGADYRFVHTHPEMAGLLDDAPPQFGRSIPPG